MTTKPIFTSKAKLLFVKRLKSSAMGNPKWSLIIERTESSYYDTIEIETATNSSIGYSITNYDIGKEYEFTYTRKGKSWDFVLINIKELIDNK